MHVLSYLNFQLQRLQDYSSLKALGFKKKDTWSGQDNIDLGAGQLSRLRIKLDEHYWVNKDNDIACMVRWMSLDQILAPGLISDEEQFRESFKNTPRRIFAYSALKNGRGIVTGNLTLMELTQKSRIYPVVLGRDQKQAKFYNVPERVVKQVLAQHNDHIKNSNLNSELDLAKKLQDIISSTGYKVK